MTLAIINIRLDQSRARCAKIVIGEKIDGTSFSEITSVLSERRNRFADE